MVGTQSGTPGMAARRNADIGRYEWEPCKVLEIADEANNTYVLMWNDTEELGTVTLPRHVAKR